VAEAGREAFSHVVCLKCTVHVAMFKYAMGSYHGMSAVCGHHGTAPATAPPRKCLSQRVLAAKSPPPPSFHRHHALLPPRRHPVEWQRNGRRCMFQIHNRRATEWHVIVARQPFVRAVASTYSSFHVMSKWHAVARTACYAAHASSHERSAGRCRYTCSKKRGRVRGGIYRHEGSVHIERYVTGVRHVQRCI